ncbi:hypothetical protein IEQ34_006947 [Dendrobium chrysotoxum]|uniref:Uncharacterized protein n=1 Tax=Dendrobium chrysotoxum TaxID=161865 RepID=A0AAV7H518_DENCH|nr:hypothetical protein IEQ34_006947 [Dendrobium chrysotoxum]
MNGKSTRAQIYLNRFELEETGRVKKDFLCSEMNDSLKLRNYPISLISFGEDYFAAPNRRKKQCRQTAKRSSIDGLVKARKLATGRTEDNTLNSGTEI